MPDKVCKSFTRWNDRGGYLALGAGTLRELGSGIGKRVYLRLCSDGTSFLVWTAERAGCVGRVVDYKCRVKVPLDFYEEMHVHLGDAMAVRVVKARGRPALWVTKHS